MLKKLKKSRFLTDEDGAVTVDWVVLTAAIVTFGIAVVVLIRPALEDSADTISTNIVSAVADALS